MGFFFAYLIDFIFQNTICMYSKNSNTNDYQIPCGCKKHHRYYHS